ncbi:MAG: hypothetical protein ACRDKT_12255 [Actinomycetota bacterium]
MSPRTMNGNPRLTARIVLAMVAIFVAVFVLFSSGPVGGLDLVFAQTASPSGPCQGVNIEWINPSGHSSEISAQDKQGDTAGSGAYHLVAWVTNVPPNAHVEFKYQIGDETEQTITTNADFVSPDTYHHFWPRNQLPDEGGGSQAITLKAQVFVSGQTAFCDEDEQDASVNTDDNPGPNPPPSSAAEAVEIDYPATGGTWGLYTPPDNSTSQGIINPKSSTGTTWVRVFYSISAPGSEPSWKACGVQREGASENGVPCELESGDTPEGVNLVAAVANDQPSELPNPPPEDDPTFDDSGDAHRVDPYRQNATSVSLVFQNADGSNAGNPSANQSSAQAPGGCSPYLVATVLDQEGRPIGNHNVDSHAQGPSDGIKFAHDVDNENNDEFAAPDQGHTREEPAWECGTETAGTGGQESDSTNQADHEGPGETDIKHVESADETTDAGTFTFRMHSPVSGNTQVTAWADEDGDDQFCDDEANGSASIAWGAGAQAPAPSGVASEETDCPVPNQSPTTTTTTSPATTTTTSPAPSTTSPSPTETTGPPVSASETRFTSFNYTRRGRNRFRGRIDSDFERCDRNRAINIKKVRRGRDRTVASARTDRRGRFQAFERRARGRYYAIARAKTITRRDGSQVDCLRARSRTIRVRR